MSANKWGNYDPNNERNNNRNANLNAVEKDPKSVAAGNERAACYKRCGKHPKMPKGEIVQSDKNKEKISMWMKCYDNCLKKNPYTTLERRLHRVATRNNKNARRNNSTRRRKNE